ncbi:vacuolar cation/proton exchanger 3-like isoform X2 [Prosopis cineraria]|uniref:vacuolar cation/proton exchanger 3-like isoform X2 n=1 Tax=Prosopis cineraria TaxID=364024 RepID=UPI00240EAC42|nr:vacuolar cation/proton exchanger 3-like isoform X2 [Prosopis cineraria]
MKRITSMGSADGMSAIELENRNLIIASSSFPRRSSSFEEASSLNHDKGKLSVVRSKVFSSIKVVVLSAKINVLMPFGPLAILLDKLFHNHGLVFLSSLLGILPLAERLGYTTEQLVCFTGPTVGSLLNATFGNATELIISIHALKSGLIRVVQQSLLGSILSNLLLVLGSAFFAGGLVFYDREQIFNKADATVDFGLLLMAVMGLLFPSVLHSTNTEAINWKSELALSRFTSCIMLVAYASYIAFQLNGRKNAQAPVDDEERGLSEVDSADAEAPEISMWESIIWLSILTVWISILSEYLVNTIEGASEDLKIPIPFISVILLPIVGNATEHVGTIIFAVKDKLDISLGVAIGSSIQISLFVIPFCVVTGWIVGRPMDLNFQLFETTSLFIAVVIVAFMLHNGTSNYLKGLMLILCYLIVAASYFVHVDPPSIQT